MNMNSDYDTSEEGYEGQIKPYMATPTPAMTPKLVPGYFVFKIEYKFFIKHFALVTCM